MPGSPASSSLTKNSLSLCLSLSLSINIICAHIYIYALVYICIYIYIHTHAFNCTYVFVYTYVYSVVLPWELYPWGEEVIHQALGGGVNDLLSQGCPSRYFARSRLNRLLPHTVPKHQYSRSIHLGTQSVPYCHLPFGSLDPWTSQHPNPRWFSLRVHVPK